MNSDTAYDIENTKNGPDIFEQAVPLSTDDIKIKNIDVGNAIRYEIKCKSDKEEIIGKQIRDCFERVLQVIVLIVLNHFKSDRITVESGIRKSHLISTNRPIL